MSGGDKWERAEAMESAADRREVLEAEVERLRQENATAAADHADTVRLYGEMIRERDAYAARWEVARAVVEAARALANEYLWVTQQEIPGVGPAIPLSKLERLVSAVDALPPPVAEEAGDAPQS